MPTSILIVEDDALDAQLSEQALLPIRAAFPGAAIQLVTNLDLALDIARTQIPPPAFVLLDPGLPDMENTIAHLSDFEERMPVVILTGHDTAEVAEKVGRPVEIVNKSQIIGNPSILHRAISRAYALFHRDTYAEQRERIERLKEIANGSP